MGREHAQRYRDTDQGAMVREGTWWFWDVGMPNSVAPGAWQRGIAHALTGGLALRVVGTAAAERWRIASAELDVPSPQTVHVENRPCVTAPFFDTTAFQNVAPGMTEAEVRDCLGYPLNRTKPAEERPFWHYTLPVETGAASVIFATFLRL